MRMCVCVRGCVKWDAAVPGDASPSSSNRCSSLARVRPVRASTIMRSTHSPAPADACRTSGAKPSRVDNAVRTRRASSSTMLPQVFPQITHSTHINHAHNGVRSLAEATPWGQSRPSRPHPEHTHSPHTRRAQLPTRGRGHSTHVHAYAGTHTQSHNSHTHVHTPLPTKGDCHPTHCSSVKNSGPKTPGYSSAWDFLRWLDRRWGAPALLLCFGLGAAGCLGVLGS